MPEELLAKCKTERFWKSCFHRFPPCTSRPFPPQVSYSEVKYPLSPTVRRADHGGHCKPPGSAAVNKTNSAHICYVLRREGCRSQPGPQQLPPSGAGPGASRRAGGATGSCLGRTARPVRGDAGKDAAEKGRKHKFSGERCSGMCCVK